jgi:ribonucleotide reductase beta subunit family protein with ferritin-like domain
MVFGTLINQDIQNKQQQQVDLKKMDANESTIQVQQEEQASNVEEPLLKEASGQYVIFPIQHDDMWKMYKTLVENFWCVPECLNIELNLSEHEQEFFNVYTCLFASCTHSFGLVSENFIEEFSQLVHIPEAKFFYGHQLFVQNTHYEMYNKLFDSLVSQSSAKLVLSYPHL